MTSNNAAYQNGTAFHGTQPQETSGTNQVVNTENDAAQSDQRWAKVILY